MDRLDQVQRAGAEQIFPRASPRKIMRPGMGVATFNSIVLTPSSCSTFQYAQSLSTKRGASASAPTSADTRRRRGPSRGGSGPVGQRPSGAREDEGLRLPPLTA